MIKKLCFATLALHLTALTLVLIGTSFVFLPFLFRLTSNLEPNKVKMPLLIWALLVPIFLVCLLLAIVNELFAWALRKRKPWAWFASLVLFILYVPSFLIPFSILGLYGLLNAETRSEFGLTKYKKC